MPRRPPLDPVQPTQQDIEGAERALRLLSEGHIQGADLTPLVVGLITQVFHETAHGRAVVVLPVESDMTTSEAADYLNVSRPYLLRLLDAGSLAYHCVGKHRRIALEDLKAYKDQQKERSYRAMERLQEEAQELGMGY